MKWITTGLTFYLATAKLQLWFLQKKVKPIWIQSNCTTCFIKATSRDRPKSAPYLRLKNSKRTSICQSIGELGTLLWNKFFGKKVSQCRKKLKGGPFGIFQHPFCRKTSKKLKGGPFREFFFRKKSLTMPKKTEREDPLGVSNIHSIAKQQKNWRGDPLGKKFFRKKSLTVPKKNWKGGPFGHARYGMLRGKTGKSFLVQFARPNGAIWCNNIL